MGIAKSTTARCDECGLEVALHVLFSTDPEKVRLKLRRKGWATRRKGGKLEDLCPRCNPEGPLARMGFRPARPPDPPAPVEAK